MTDRNAKLLDTLKQDYPDAKCELNFNTPFQLLIAVVLSAQCTDKRVNIVTSELFKVAKTPSDFQKMPLETLEKLIYSTGFYHNKAVAIKSLSDDIVERFGGKMPENFDDLKSLRGVGNKTASVVTCVALGGNALPVDTHVFRLAHRLGLSDGKTPDAVMNDLKAEFPEKSWYDLHHTLIFHGRYTCKSQRPSCDKCNLQEFCNYYNENVRNNK